MIKITLPNGAIKEFEASSVTGKQVAEAIGPRLAKDAIGAVVNGELRDLSAPITADSTLAIVTPKADDSNAVYLTRHSAAHVMAEAITRLYPQTKLAYGPPVDTGFYYDMELDHKLTADDFVKIEEEIKKILAEDRPFTRYELAKDAALEKLGKEGNPYKVDNAQRALDADPNAVISFYATGAPGKNWEDLCRGPHVPSTARIGAIKVMSVAGAYWHGDETKQQLQRVYGIAFPTQKDLDQHLQQIDEAKKRDHRVIGKQLGLFTISNLVGPGLILWMPKGGILRAELENFMREELIKRGYESVYTPHIGKVDLYKISGHYPYYKESQFPTIKMNERDKDDPDEYLLKPMNCPHHIQIYAAEPRSYRDLPLRLAEFGTVYRFEQSGELNGMTRVRGFTQDDAHLFCTPEQVEEEFRSTVQMVMHVFTTLGFSDYECRVSLRDPASPKYMGDPANWDRAENTLRKVVKEVGIKFEEGLGEAAFYGPKIDFMVKDVIGRKWQLGTVQLDYNLPERFELEYIGSDNARHRPVMIHRAPFGSMERFTGILIEHFAGSFPTWLSPMQVAILPISEKFNEYADSVHREMLAAGIRAEVDKSNDKIGAKIRRTREVHTPYMAIVGATEAEGRTVSLRTRDDHGLGSMPVEPFIAAIRQEIASRSLAGKVAAEAAKFWPANWWQLGHMSVSLGKWIGKHIVGLQLVFERDKKTDVEVYSGFLLYYSDVPFWVSAAHVFEEIEQAKKDASMKVRAVRWLDDNPTKGAKALPTSVDGPFGIYIDSNKFDVGLQPLSNLEVQGLSQSRVFITEEAWKENLSSKPEGYYLVGYPRETMQVEQRKADNRHVAVKTTVGLVCLPIEKIAREEPKEAGDFWDHGAALYAKVVGFADADAKQLESISGMSGGVVVSVERSGADIVYRVYGVQSAWLPESRIIRAEPIEQVAAAIRILFEAAEKQRRAAPAE